VIKSSQLELDIFSVVRVITAASESPAVRQHPLLLKPISFRWSGPAVFENGNAKAKLAENLAALRLLRELQLEDRMASAAEQAPLARYNGWGGLALVFEPEPREWRAEAEELKLLLAPADYNSARASVMSAFYTPHDVCRLMYEGLQRLGFRGGKVLEPATGTGIFLASQPPEWRCDWAAIELDRVSGRILHQLQPEAGVQISGLEAATLSDGAYDLVVGNVPFADYPIHDRRLGNPLVHDYFLLRSVELVRPGGLVAVCIFRRWWDTHSD
jgi:hypothetical protein